MSNELHLEVRPAANGWFQVIDTTTGRTRGRAHRTEARALHSIKLAHQAAERDAAEEATIDRGPRAIAGQTYTRMGTGYAQTWEN